MSMRAVLIEDVGGREFVAVRLMNPEITKTHKEHELFDDMLTLMDVREKEEEGDSVNQGDLRESQKEESLVKECLQETKEVENLVG